MLLYGSLLALIVLNVIAWNQAAGITILRRRVRHLGGLPGFLRMVFCGMRVQRPALTELPQHLGLEYTEHTFCSDDGISLHAWHIPAAEDIGRPLVLTFNWLGSSKSALLPHIREFHAAGHAVFAVDLRGHGGSGGNETTLGWAEGRDVLATLQYVRLSLRPESILLHGVSLGAVSILRAFHLCDLNAGYAREGRGGRVCGAILEAAFDRLRNTVRHRVATFGVPECLPFADLLLFWGGLRQGFPPFRHNPAEYARRADVPALLLHGAADPYIREAEARRIAENFSSGLCVFHSVAGNAHGSALLAHPALWRAAIQDFLPRLL